MTQQSLVVTNRAAAVNYFSIKFLWINPVMSCRQRTGHWAPLQEEITCSHNQTSKVESHLFMFTPTLALACAGCALGGDGRGADLTKHSLNSRSLWLELKVLSKIPGDVL